MPMPAGWQRFIQEESMKEETSCERAGCRRRVKTVLAVVLACLCAAGCSRGPTDEELRSKIAAALGNDTRLQVAVKDGEIIITGTVPDNTTRLQVFKKAAETAGGKKVTERIHVPPPPRVYTLPAGTTVRLVMLDGVDSSIHRPGQTFRAALVSALVSGDTVVVPEKTEVVVMLQQVQQSGKLTGQSQLELAMKSVAYLGTTYELKSSSVTAAGESRGTQSAKRIGIATGVGAVAGALLGKGKGALIGAGVGAAGSTAYQLATSGPSVRVPAQAKLDFTLQDAVTFTLPPKEK
jgi:hypothetical protein